MSKHVTWVAWAMLGGWVAGAFYPTWPPIDNVWLDVLRDLFSRFVCILVFMQIGDAVRLYRQEKTDNEAK